MARWTKQERKDAGVGILFMGLAAFGVSYESWVGNFSISASGIEPIEALLLSFITIVGGLYLWSTS